MGTLDHSQNYYFSTPLYALTRLLYFVITGKTKTDKINSNLKTFITKGLDSNKDRRFKNIDELNQAFQILLNFEKRDDAM
ncbi:MAG: hypothetical protein D3903_09830 [Candidatus Electrothrix sp. GM3_4]|nr:hypothetical protein [Candidatus Electrothrix sp. GM3_4]